MSIDRDELLARIDIVHRMTEEGRRTFGRWGWVFVVWGAGHVAAASWTLVDPGAGGLPWMLLMSLCGVATAIGATLVRRAQGKTTSLDRSLAGIWSAFGLALGVAWIGGGSLGVYAGVSEFYFPFYLLMGAASFASGAALRLGVQKAVALLWWAAGPVTLAFPQHAMETLIAVAVVCEIWFGLYLTRNEARDVQASRSRPDHPRQD